MEEVAPGIVEADEGRGDLKLAAGVSSCCVSGGKVAAKALTTAAVSAAATAYFVFEGNHNDVMIRFVSLVWIVSWEGSG